MEAAATQETNEDENLVWKAQALMDKVTSSPDNPNPNVLHALSSLLETQEFRYMEETGHSSLNNDRASHNVGWLGNFIRENDEFFELISSKFLSEARYQISVQVAAARLLFSCTLTWMYPHVFEEPVLENVKGWVMDETTRSSGEDNNWKHESERKKSSDSEMLRTYSTGLLAVCLAGLLDYHCSGNQSVEDVLTSGLSAKLMQYLRIRALGEIPTSQRDNHYLAESKNASSANHIRGREDGRNRFRKAPETSHLDAPRIIEKGSLDDQSAGRDHDRIQACGDERWVDGGPPAGLDEVLKIYEEVDGDFEKRRHGRDLRDGKIKLGDRNCPARSGREEDFDESVRDESSSRRMNRGLVRVQGKGRVNNGIVENEQALSSPGSGIRLGLQCRSIKERSLNRNLDI